MAFYNTFCDVTHAYQQFTFMIIYAGFFFFCWNNLLSRSLSGWFAFSLYVVFRNKQNIRDISSQSELWETRNATRLGIQSYLSDFNKTHQTKNIFIRKIIILKTAETAETDRNLRLIRISKVSWFVTFNLSSCPASGIWHVIKLIFFSFFEKEFNYVKLDIFYLDLFGAWLLDVVFRHKFSFYYYTLEPILGWIFIFYGYIEFHVCRREFANFMQNYDEKARKKVRKKKSR